MKELVRYYETYFELYGRKVNLITFEGTGNATDEVAARADAAQIAVEFKPFVVFGGPALTSAFADELAAHQVICIGCTPGQPPSFYSDRDPYVWGLDGSPTQKKNHVVEFMTKQMIGKNANARRRRGEGSTRARSGCCTSRTAAPRRSWPTRSPPTWRQPDRRSPRSSPYQLDPTTIQATATQVITKLKAAGVTTVVFSGDPVAPRDFTKEATAQEYFPEWVISASDIGRRHRVRPHVRPGAVEARVRRHASSPPARPTDQIGSFFFYKWFTGQDPPADGQHRRHLAEPGAVLRGPPRCRSQPHPRDVPRRCVRPTGYVRRSGDQPAVPVVRRQGLLARARTTWASTMPR